MRLAYSAVEAAEALWNPNLIRFALDRAMLAFLSNRLDFLSDRFRDRRSPSRPPLSRTFPRRIASR